MEEIGGELLAPPAAEAQAEEGGEPAAAAGPAVVPETVEPAAEEESVEAPAGEGGAIEGGTPGVLYVRTTKYYYLGGQRVAMRQVDTWGGDVVYYLVTDHLGTTSLVLCGNVDGCDSLAGGGTVPNGGRVAESRHYPYGAVRWTWPPEANGTLPTDYRFTGQRDVGLGLTHMGARFLDSALGRWLSTDAFVPNPTDPQELNRYSYCRNSPLRYIDPLGLFTDDAIIGYLQSQYGESWESVWKQWQADETWIALLRAAQAGDVLTLMHETGLSSLVTS